MHWQCYHLAECRRTQGTILHQLGTHMHRVPSTHLPAATQQLASSIRRCHTQTSPRCPRTHPRCHRTTRMCNLNMSAFWQKCSLACQGNDESEKVPAITYASLRNELTEAAHVWFCS